MKNQNRRDFLTKIGFGVIGIALAPSLVSYATQKNKPKNILFIGVDDLRTELNCYGATHIHSPNIDKLAENGVLFQEAFVQQAVCSASRASFLMGCRPNTVGVDYPYSKYFVNEFMKKYPTLPGYFYQNGYYARNLGKIHHGYKENLTEKSWEPPFKPHYQLSENIEEGKKYNGGRGITTPPFEMADVPDEKYKDAKTATEAINTLRRIAAKKDEQSFFLSVGFVKPHLPFVAPKKYWDLYDPEQIKLSPNKIHPENSPEYSTTHYALANYSGQSNKDGKETLSDERARELRHGYYACVSFVDAQIGRIIRELERLGLKEDTIIVFWTDHGWHLGDHNSWGKCTNFDRSTRSPLIISIPGNKNNGKSTSALVEYVDLFPTLAELASLQIPQHLEGTSMLPVLNNPDIEWKSAVFSQFPRGRKLEGYSIRTNRYRYVEWCKKDGIKILEIESRELYDHKNDPNESVNIAHLPENKKLIENLSSRLKAGWKNELPKGVTNNSNIPLAPVAVGLKE